MNYKILLLITIVFSPTSAIHGQDSTSHYPFYDTGIFTEYGSGIYSMKDESFSSVKYSGRMPYFSAGFSRFHNNYGSCLGITYNSSSKILNNSISADVLNFSLFHDFQYPIGSFNLFSKDVYCYLGPSTEFYLFYNKQNFANSGLYFNYSFFSLASLGINSIMILTISQRFQATGTVHHYFRLDCVCLKL